MVDSERFELARAQYLQALARLLEVLSLQETAILRDALIQRFEFTYELAWKTLFYWLRLQGEQVPQMARPVLRAAFVAQLLDNAQVWEKINAFRDETSHTYNEARAAEVATFVREEAIGAFQSLARALQALP